MRFLANENFPGDAVTALESARHDIVWVRTAAPGSKDEDVLAWAERESRVLLYQPSHTQTRHARARRGHPRLKARVESKTWMAGTSPAMTKRMDHDLCRSVLPLTRILASLPGVLDCRHRVALCCFGCRCHQQPGLELFSPPGLVNELIGSDTSR